MHIEGLVWRLSTEEEMDAMIKKIADLIAKYDLETAAILFFESTKPLAPVSGGLSRVFVSPWLHVIGINSRTVINTLEEPKNIEKLLQLLEKSVGEKRERKKQEKKVEEKSSKEEVKTESKKGWRRFLHL